ncbi:MAG: hypothetical protein GF347_05005 [Candidatus Moranbacteria bacterium]|nr:hypothetical protein [Candidatus Moranbacteria bacterium]
MAGTFEKLGYIEDFEVNYWGDSSLPQMVEVKYENWRIQVMLININDFPSQEVRDAALVAAQALQADFESGRKAPCGNSKCYVEKIWRSE